MQHEVAESYLLDLASGALKGEKRAEVSTHVAACEECRSWLEVYARLEGALSAESSVHPTADALARYALVAEADPQTDAHLTSCADCRRLVDLTQEAVAGEAEEALAVRSGWGAARHLWAGGRRGGWWLAAAATLLAAAILIPVWQRSTPRSEVGALLSSEQSPASSLMTSQAIGAGEVATLRAQSVVALSEGFSVAQGAHLTIEVGGSSDPRAPARSIN